MAARNSLFCQELFSSQVLKQFVFVIKQMVINNFNLFIFVLAETKLLKRVWERKGPRAKWIVKPPALARGNGIKVRTLLPE